MKLVDYDISCAHGMFYFLKELEELTIDEAGEIYAQLTHMELDFIHDAYTKEHLMCIEKRDLARKVWFRRKRDDFLLKNG